TKCISSLLYAINSPVIAYLGTCAHPVGQSFKFIHSFIHGTGMSSHHQQAPNQSLKTTPHHNPSSTKLYI
uniref:Uncharacterized protein n=1 Tax=Acanthochromis polyacanthus TaxID=80966 RepID=A0A3Q1GH20_9TELE